MIFIASSSAIWVVDKLLVVDKSGCLGFLLPPRSAIRDSRMAFADVSPYENSLIFASSFYFSFRFESG